MKGPALDRFRQKLSAGECLYGVLVKLEAAAITEIAAGLGLDWVIIDLTLGHLDWSTAVEHIRASSRSDIVTMVLLDAAYPGGIDRAIDVGADGIAIQGARTRDELQSLVDRAQDAAVKARGGLAPVWRYPSTGSSSDPLPQPVVVAVIEATIGLETLQDLLTVDAVDVFVSALGLPSAEGQTKEIRGRGRYAGVVAASSEEILQSKTLGLSMLGLGSDAGIIFEGLRSVIDFAGSLGDKSAGREARP